ncbi:MAG: Peptidoglycan-binding lysin domain protein [Candidatus Sulfotelmatobacter sp.]|nr:Peptidoglycan-binding lysin domain protein [Candidatus Sulfotelmatobacter sp.]
MWRSRVFGCWLTLVILAFTAKANSQDPCPLSNGDGRTNSQYPELEAPRCVTVQQGADSTTIWGSISGSRWPTKSDDPVCGDAQWEVVCRRICGDLPSGKQAGSLVGTGITPGGWARFEEHLEVFDKGDHQRVCLRAKNWANETRLSWGPVKSFVYTVKWAQPPPPPPPVWPKEHIVVKGECLSKIAESVYGRQNWPKIHRANRKLIKDPDLIFPNQKLSLPE